ncbi:hypothetical protein P4S72_13050 [Vibrio sp. PP-XX7]
MPYKLRRKRRSTNRQLCFRAASGSQRPLFIVPEASGEMLYGTLLTSYIDADIPVYGLMSPDRNLPPFQTMQGLPRDMPGLSVPLSRRARTVYWDGRLVAH